MADLTREEEYKLLAAVKNYLDITWDDQATDDKIRGLMYTGIRYLDGKIGEEADYTSAGMPRMLLMDFVRYARDNALDVFEENFRELLLGSQSERLVRAFEAKAIQTEQ